MEKEEKEEEEECAEVLDSAVVEVGVLVVCVEEIVGVNVGVNVAVDVVGVDVGGVVTVEVFLNVCNVVVVNGREDILLLYSI
jgi:hypothetical protein